MEESGGNAQETNVNDLFNKKFSFQRQENWCLPSEDQVFSQELWKHGSLQDLKCKLNSIKSELNDKGVNWQKHTTFVNKAGAIKNHVKQIINVDLLTQAWLKFYEILNCFPIVPVKENVLRSLHLCEAPGAFISALNYYLNLNCRDKPWEWYGNTLNPYYEGHPVKSVIVDDRLLFRTLNNWLFGSDNTGDVMSSSYLDDLVKFVNAKGDVHLVTADGSISCTDNPGEQELIVSKLQFSEILIALCTLSPGGSLVLKKFTFFECISICTMYLLNCVFNKVHVFKPATSKSGNSEVYVICLDYMGIDRVENYITVFKKYDHKEKALFPESSIPESFLRQLEECCSVFAEYQISALKENLTLYGSLTPEKIKHLDQVKRHCAQHYVSLYSISPIQDYLWLFERKGIKTVFGTDHSDLKELYFKTLSGTYDEQEQCKHYSWEDTISDVENRMNECFPITKKRHLDTVFWIPVWKEMLKAGKAKNFKEWIVTGKPYKFVTNSKFCNTLLLSLWNQLVLYNDQVSMDGHRMKSYQNWDSFSLQCLLMMNDNFSTNQILFVNVDSSCDSSSMYLFLKEIFECREVKQVCLQEIETDNYHFSESRRVFFIDCTLWFPESFHCEVLIKQKLVSSLCEVLKCMKIGDMIMIIFPSLLTRYTVGVFFMLVSLFTRTACLLPTDCSPSMCGQLWILDNFRNPSWTSSVISYFEELASYEDNQKKTVLETVAMTNICGGKFYEFLLDLNLSFTLTRLRAYLTIEKIKLNKMEGK